MNESEQCSSCFFTLDHQQRHDSRTLVVSSDQRTHQCFVDRRLSFLDLRNLLVDDAVHSVDLNPLDNAGLALSVATADRLQFYIMVPPRLDLDDDRCALEVDTDTAYVNVSYGVPQPSEFLGDFEHVGLTCSTCH